MSTWPERSECGHDRYWVGNYGTCMACRADKAEAAIHGFRQHSARVSFLLEPYLTDDRIRDFEKQHIRDVLEWTPNRIIKATEVPK